MKKIFLSLLFVCFCTSLFSYAFEKIYVENSSIRLEENEILIQLSNNEYALALALYSDENGFYVNELWPLIPFTCEKCHTWNNCCRTYCKNCGQRRPD